MYIQIKPWICFSHAFHWDYDVKSGSYSRSALDGDLASVSLYRLFDDLQSESRPSNFSTNGLIGEQPVPNVGRHSMPRIFHSKANRVTRGVDLPSDGDRSSVGHCGNGIIHQVVQHREKTTFIGYYGWKIIQALTAHDDSSGLRNASERR